MDVPNVQGELFDGAPILDWLPDETLFSLVSRIHGLWGACDPGRTASLLFGRRRGGTQHDLPGFLDTFVRQTGGRLGGAQEIARGRTLMSYYRHFVSPAREQELVDAMCAGTVGHLKFRLGLLTSRFRANHPLKACLTCMKQDMEEHGWAYWHLGHQLPGLWCCPEHGEILRESLLKSTGVRRFFWVLPRAEGLMSIPAGIEREHERVLQAAARLGALTQGLVQHGRCVRIEPAALYRVYRKRLRELGWLTDTDRVRWAVVSNAFVEHVRLLRLIPELDCLAASQEAAEVQLGRLLRPARSGTHPLRHLAVIDWLYRDVGTFLQDYESLTEPRPVGHSRIATEAVSQLASADPRREQLVVLLRREAMSLRAAAETLGIDVGTAMMWATKEGISTSRRPKMLTPNKREQLIKLLRQGAEKAAAAEAIGVSIQAVTRVLFTEVGLHEAWTDIRRSSVQRKHRRAWERLMLKHPAAGVKILRSLAPATYVWLYRNDRDWLEQNKPAATPFIPKGLASSAWFERDLRLSAAVRVAALSLAVEPGRRRLQLWELYQAVPALKPKLSVLQRLPLTRKVIERALAWRPGGGGGQLELE